jgi:hypothetical protein
MEPDILVINEIEKDKEIAYDLMHITTYETCSCRTSEP